ncbi:hypothetical protein SAMN00808754_1402 [Thermanaeromonas toyohensis ToBE]|uniref:Uncharacterized protein n=1 Tax=Thermanaeromonas toyohensis ToBE TaxID=698762 RepID=A0A1W1VRY2_9FIRM|nr:hypothetical protein SAMN00808754_1402 [Thermanaeromonas toyohensis ToBE]
MLSLRRKLKSSGTGLDEGGRRRGGRRVRQGLGVPVVG